MVRWAERRLALGELLQLLVGFGMILLQTLAQIFDLLVLTLFGRQLAHLDFGHTAFGSILNKRGVFAVEGLAVVIGSESTCGAPESDGSDQAMAQVSDWTGLVI